jgi:abequosyltransferase
MYDVTERTKTVQTSMPQPYSYELSFCISTLNGATTIGETLQSIIDQAPEECEIVVLDGASTDTTGQVVSEYASRFPRLRYIRQDTNSGVDADFDRAACLANGRYCWFMSDDDLLKPGAISTVLDAVRGDVSMVVVNAEFCHPDNMAHVLLDRYIDIQANRTYRPDETDRLFVEMGGYFRYNAFIVIKREVWLVRDRQRYYGTLFAALGTIFQDRLPGNTLVIAKPFISIRSGHPRWVPRAFEIACFKWPSVVWSLPFTDSAKRKVSAAEPWRSIKLQMLCRAWGAYSIEDYKRWIKPLRRPMWIKIVPALVAHIPGVLVNTFFVLYYSLPFTRNRGTVLIILRASPYNLRHWKLLKRESTRAELRL